MKKTTCLTIPLFTIALAGCNLIPNESGTTDALVNDSIQLNATTTKTCGIDYSKPTFLIEGTDTIEKWEYNEEGLLTKHIIVDDVEGNSLFERFSYTPQGQVQKRIFKNKADGLEQVEIYTYNEKGLLTFSEVSKNNYTKFCYDEQDRLIKKEGVFEYERTGVNAHTLANWTTTFTYNGNTVTETHTSDYMMMDWNQRWVRHYSNAALKHDTLCQYFEYQTDEDDYVLLSEERNRYKTVNGQTVLENSYEYNISDGVATLYTKKDFAYDSYGRLTCFRETCGGTTSIIDTFAYQDNLKITGTTTICYSKQK